MACAVTFEPEYNPLAAAESTIPCMIDKGIVVAGTMNKEASRLNMSANSGDHLESMYCFDRDTKIIMTGTTDKTWGDKVISMPKC